MEESHNGGTTVLKVFAYSHLTQRMLALAGIAQIARFHRAHAGA